MLREMRVDFKPSPCACDEEEKGGREGGGTETEQRQSWASATLSPSITVTVMWL